MSDEYIHVSLSGEENIFCFTNFLQVPLYIMTSTRCIKAILQHRLPDPKGVKEVALCGVDNQLDIVKSQLHCWFYTRCSVKDKICSLAISQVLLWLRN